MGTNLLVGSMGTAIAALGIVNLVLLSRRIRRTGAPLPRRSIRAAAIGFGFALVMGIAFIGVTVFGVPS